MEIVQQGKALVISATETGGRGIGSMTCPPPPCDTAVLGLDRHPPALQARLGSMKTDT